jgi:RNA polymerase sigma factor (sigma-70 family)
MVSPPYVSKGKIGELLLPDATRTDSYTAFVADTESRLRRALTAAWGPDRGREAAAEALAYGWEHWDRIEGMDNPAGYLYRVGRNRARRLVPRRVVLPEPEGRDSEYWVEPELPDALARLSEQQRVVVALVHGYQWTLAEVAELLGISKGTVQRYGERGLMRLRRHMKVDL